MNADGALQKSWFCMRSIAISKNHPCNLLYLSSVGLKTPRKVTTCFGQCSPLSCNSLGNFHEFQPLSCYLLGNFHEIQPLSCNSLGNSHELQPQPGTRNQEPGSRSQKPGAESQVFLPHRIVTLSCHTELSHTEWSH